MCLVFWLINVNATFTLHLHGVVTQLFIQVVSRASPRLACWQSHLDPSRFGTLGLAPGHGRGQTQIILKNGKNVTSENMAALKTAGGMLVVMFKMSQVSKNKPYYCLAVLSVLVIYMQHFINHSTERVQENVWHILGHISNSTDTNLLNRLFLILFIIII